MSRRFSRLAAAIAFAGAVLSASCAQLPRPDALLGRDTPGSERLNTAISLLSEGREGRAKDELSRLLREQPNNRQAQSLMAQIERDPSDLLGRRSRPYSVREGDTMSSIAQRFLGDPLMFYALSKYNALSAPSSLRAGQSIRVPVHAMASRPAAPPGPRAARRDREGGSAFAAAGTTSEHVRDPARASALRARALAQLNSGRADDAVALLRQALALDEGNPAIQQDLSRAMRVRDAVASRS